jgi:hypothetical protein
MSIFSSLFGKKKEPQLNPVREALFGDMPLDMWPRSDTPAAVFPWSTFAQARNFLAAGNTEGAIGCWRHILSHSGLEPRHYLQAWHFLRQFGQKPTPESAKQLLGVVIEVTMPGGLDLLAAYPDHSARYYNYSGAGVVWEHPDNSLDAAIDALLGASEKVVALIGPWDKARPPAPQRDEIRLNFLTPSGLHFGQGSMGVLAKDSMGGPVVQTATQLMQALITKSGK